MISPLATLATLPPPPPDRRGWPWTEDSPAVTSDGDAPRITIVTPSFNQGHFIEETIRSVLLQGYPNLEYLVMDGGSGDETVAILRKYDAWLTWVSEADAGQADAINKGLRRATGEILAYLNSDDLYLPGALATVSAAFRAHPGVGLVYGDCQAVQADGTPRGLIRGRPFDVQRMIRLGEFVPQQAAFWSRAATEAVGLFDPSLHYCMDHDYFIRIGRALPGLYLAQPLAVFRFHDASKSVSNEERHWRESMQVSRRYGLSPWSPWLWLRVARHRGLRALPGPLRMVIRRHLLRRAHDPAL